jgi:protein TonB
MAKVGGIVILEATVGEDGVVESVKILRSLKFFDGPAVDAVKEWRYSPLVLNGRPTPFILSVTFSFSIK